MNLYKVWKTLRWNHNFFVTRERKTNHSKLYEKKVDKHQSYKTILDLGYFINKGYTIIFIDEVYLCQNTFGSVVTIKKRTQIKDYDSSNSKDRTKKIGLITATTLTQTLGIMMFERSIDSTNFGYFILELCKEVDRLSIGKCIYFFDNYWAHMADKFFGSNNLEIYFKKNNAYNFAANMIEFTYSSLKIEYYHTKGNIDIYSNEGQTMINEILLKYLKKDWNKISIRYIKRILKTIEDYK